MHNEPPTSRFKRDYRREKSGVLGKKLDKLLMEAVNLLANDKLLSQRYFDHALTGVIAEYSLANLATWFRNRKGRFCRSQAEHTPNLVSAQLADIMINFA